MLAQVLAQVCQQKKQDSVQILYYNHTNTNFLFCPPGRYLPVHDTYKAVQRFEVRFCCFFLMTDLKGLFVLHDCPYITCRSNRSHTHMTYYPNFDMREVDSTKCQDQTEAGTFTSMIHFFFCCYIDHNSFLLNQPTIRRHIFRRLVSVIKALVSMALIESF